MKTLLLLLAMSGVALSARTSAPIADVVVLAGAADFPEQAERRANVALKTTEGRDAALALIIRGLARYELGRYRAAARDLAKAYRGGTRLRDYALFFEAESRFHAGEYRRAESLYRKVKDKHVTSTWRHRAHFRIGDCLIGRGLRRKAIKHLEDALYRYPEFPHPAAIRFALADLERHRGRLSQSARWLRQVVRRYPAEPLALEAERLVAALEAQGVEPADETAAAIYKHSRDLRQRKYYHRALDGFQRLLTDARAGRGMRRRARFQIGRTLLRMERFPEANATYAALAKEGGRESRRLAQRWQSRALARLGRFEDAASALLSGSGDRDKPTAETMVAVGWLYFDGARYKSARKWFRRAAKRSNGWSRSTRWMRGWLAFRLADFKTSTEVFKRMQAGSKRFPHRYGYWLARSLAKAGELDAAADTWRGVISHAPLSYYAYQARARMRELGLPLEPEPVAEADPEAEDDEPDIGEINPEVTDSDEAVTLASLPDTPMSVDRPLAKPPAPKEPEVEAEPAPETPFGPGGWGGAVPRPRPPLLEPLRTLAVRWGNDIPDLIEVYELAAVGKPRLAFMRLRWLTDERRALRNGWNGAYKPRPYVDNRKDRDVGEWGRQLRGDEGVATTRGRQRFVRGMTRRIHNAVREAYILLGDEHYARRHRPRRPELLTPPEARENNANWRSEYPRAFREMVEDRAAAYALDPYFIWALMRVESTYNPWAISRASARGLMQIMPQTGGLIAARAGWRNYGTPLLFEPEVAIEMAAWYFHQLLTKFNGQLPLAIASYNAGPHRVAAWLERKGHLPMDEFIEEMPFTEAREYAKKVLRHLALYRRIYEGDARLAVNQVIDADYRDNINF